MTTPSMTPADGDEPVKPGLAEGPVPDVFYFPYEVTLLEPAGQPTVMGPMTVVSGVRRLSTISEQEPDTVDTDYGSQDTLGIGVWAGSSFSLCSDDRNKKSSTSCSSNHSYQPDSGDDCATILLACLHCRFHECLGLLPQMCERAVGRCFPSYPYTKASNGKEQAGGDCSGCSLELDCSCCGSCQDTAELLELAMEISEICYR